MAAVKKCILVSILCILSVTFTGCADNPRQILNDTIDATYGLKDMADGNKEYLEVYTCAKEAIKQQLDSPSTAVFATYGNKTLSRLGATMSEGYNVKSYVDVKNLMGTEVRLNFEVNIYWEDGEWVYELLYLE